MVCGGALVTPAISLRCVSRSFPLNQNAHYLAIENLSLDINKGSFIAFVGPSGCGKTTLLNIMAGLLAPTSGDVEVDGRVLRGINRNASYLFQRDTLLPWKSVVQNIELGLRLRGDNPRTARALALEWAARIGLLAFTDAYPSQLSVGMRRRVSIAQAWAVSPEILLMDEPFGPLDVHLRGKLHSELLTLWSAGRETIVFVTHDLEEAITLADQVVVLSAGPATRIVGVFKNTLERPRNVLDIRSEPTFLDLYRSIWEALRPEVLKYYDDNATR